ncbi:MAG: ATP-binding cassette domain-containing protein [Synergistaceae bacterium]|nr:ATP-binding cassette domain-containing protein [Synergistaceae bacterium]
MKIGIFSVTKIFAPDIVALDNVNITIDSGEFVYLMGKSGSGKSTLIRLLTREVLPTRGKVVVGDYDLSKIKKADIPFYRRDIGTVSQDFKLIPKLTAYENVAFALEAMGIPYRYVKARANKVLDQVGMWRRRAFYPPQLSGGEQQRVAIARALSKAPALILADEPTGNLDAKTTEDIMDLFWNINSSGITIVMATHNLKAVRGHHSRLIELQSGFLTRDIRIGK